MCPRQAFPQCHSCAAQNRDLKSARAASQRYSERPGVREISHGLDIMMDVTKVLSTLSKTFQNDTLRITHMVTTLDTTLPLLNQLKLEKGPPYKRFNEGYCQETGILQKDPVSYFKVFDPREMPQERFHLATYKAIMTSSHLLSSSVIIILWKRRRQASLLSDLL